MSREEMLHRIACLLNPQTDMSGNNINRIHGQRRRDIEELVDQIIMEKTESASVMSILGDRNAVHVNMLRGLIAKPSVDQIIHIYGRDELKRALDG